MNNLATTIAVVPLLAFLLAACASMGPQDTDQYIFLNESETLFVKFTGSMPDLADNMARSRRDDSMQVMEELLYQLPIQVHVLREREEPENGPLPTVKSSRIPQAALTMS
ncbi:MAG: hypothetical protein ACI92G_001583 [Candidatus Pelagisphaera sp.]